MSHLSSKLILPCFQLFWTYCEERDCALLHSKKVSNSNDKKGMTILLSSCEGCDDKMQRIHKTSCRFRWGSFGCLELLSRPVFADIHRDLQLFEHYLFYKSCICERWTDILTFIKVSFFEQFISNIYIILWFILWTSGIYFI